MSVEQVVPPQENGARPRVCIISAVAPYPVDAGKKVVLTGLLDYLADRFGPENVHYVLVGDHPVDASRFPVVLHRVPGPGRGDVLWALVTSVIAGRASLQEALLRSSGVGSDLARTLRGLEPDIEIYDTVRLGQYIERGAAAHRVLYVDDLFSERYSTMLRAMRRHPDIEVDALGNFRAHVPARLRTLASRAAVQRVLLRIERRLVRRSEDRQVRRFARSLLVNAREAGALARRAGSSRVSAIPPLLETAGPPLRRVPATPAVFVFLGLLSLPHNDDGLRSFLRDCWPEVLRKLPDARLRVIGRDPRPGLSEVIERYPGSVVLDGYVDDLDGALSTATALVNPLRFGSGVKIKVIEALGRGVPIVSTPVGADGIADGLGEGLLVGDSVDEFVRQMVRLVDPATNAEASRASAAHFARVYGRDAGFRAYDAAILTPELLGRDG